MWPYRLAAPPASHVRTSHFRAHPTEPPKRCEAAAVAKNGWGKNKNTRKNRRGD
jgi:hypothetical protein